MRATRSTTSWPAIHGGVFLAAWAGTAVCLPSLPWPWHLLLPVTVYFSIATLVPPLRRTAVWPAIGRLDAVSLIAATVLTALTIGILLFYQSWMQPDVTGLGTAIPVAAFGNLILAGVCFSIGNAVLEELAFRSVLVDSIVAEWGSAFAVGLTAMCFGIAHFHGYPPGLLGAVLAGFFGVALGLLRWWSGGLLLAIVCHIGADATIFSILATEGAFVE